ncbi:phenylalanine--tRNA ligase subunit beta [Candidatus Woesearchaeota archaeon]|nr:phenylalanine--tRNA ligase subunit beta [Candidatus Woesearchaeota archaeon]
MPTLTYDKKDFFSLLGKLVSEEELVDLLSCLKAELTEYGENISVEFNDTNLPWIWSVEGLTAMLRGLLGVEKGLATVDVKKPERQAIVDKVAGRPFVATFVAKGKMSDALLENLIQLQEKFCESFGKKRQKVSVGLYPAKNIAFPVRYTEVEGSLAFTPLDGEHMSIKDILEKHPKGKEYGKLLEGMKKFPVFMDANNHILSLPPIINSEDMGKVDASTKELFFDATGTDEKAVRQTAAIFAFALASRGFTIEAMNVSYPKHNVVMPDLTPQEVKLDMGLVDSLLDLDISEPTAKGLLEKMRYGTKGAIQVPAMRSDIMHNVDLVEDVAAAYGYGKMEPVPVTSHSIGGTTPLQEFADDVRMLLVGTGYQEIFSAMLTNPKSMTKDMRTKAKLVELEAFYSSSYSALRNWLTPVLVQFLTQNKHVDYPQHVFEEGLVTNEKLQDERKLAFASAHNDVSATEMKEVLDFVFGAVGTKYEVKEKDLDWCIPGRSAEILVNKHPVGWFGELHPEVLANAKLEVPVAAAEIDLGRLHDYLTAS